MLLCMAPTCFHSPSVCCVWVSGSPAAMTVLSEWSNTPTLWFPQHPAKTDWRPSEAFWTESQLQLACSVTVYTITPFKICQLRCAACQNPSDCCSAVSTFPHNILYLQHPIAKVARLSRTVPASSSERNALVWILLWFGRIFFKVPHFAHFRRNECKDK